MDLPFNSGPFQTYEQANASIMGAMAELGKGHNVTIKSTTVNETDGAFYAVAMFEISDLEENEDIKAQTEEKVSEAREAEKLIETENDLFVATHAMHASAAERAFPDVAETVEPTDVMADDGTGTASGESGGNAGGASMENGEVASQDMMLPQKEREQSTQLSEQLQNEFTDAEEGTSGAAAPLVMAGLNYNPAPEDDDEPDPSEEPERRSDDEILLLQDDELDDEELRRKRELDLVRVMQPEAVVETPEQPSPST